MDTVINGLNCPAAPRRYRVFPPDFGRGPGLNRVRGEPPPYGAVTRCNEDLAAESGRARPGRHRVPRWLDGQTNASLATTMTSAGTSVGVPRTCHDEGTTTVITSH